MKSLLVDVLREAQDESSGDNPSPTRDEGVPSDRTTTTEKGVEAAELDLLATGQYLKDETVVEDVADRPSTVPLTESDADNETPLPDRPDSMAATAVLSDLGAVLQTGPPVILRIGRITPLMCLVAVIVAAGGSLFVNRATSSSLNDRLDEIANLGQAADSNRATDRATIRSRVFGVAKEDSGNPVDSQASSAVPVATAATKAAGESRLTRNPDADRTIDVSRSAAAVGAVDDRAFELVAAGYAAYQQRNYRDAEYYYEQALAQEANHRDALLGIAAVYGQTDRDSLALDAYQKVLQIEPGNTIAASAILSVRSASADWDNESDLKLLLQQFPDAHHLHFALGTIYVSEQRWAAARHAFLAAWQLAPANANYAYNLAVSLERIGDVVEAARYYETALANADESSRVDRAAVERQLNQLAIIARDDR